MKTLLAFFTLICAGLAHADTYTTANLSGVPSASFTYRESTNLTAASNWVTKATWSSGQDGYMTCPVSSTNPPYRFVQLKVTDSKHSLTNTEFLNIITLPGASSAAHTNDYSQYRFVCVATPLVTSNAPLVDLIEVHFKGSGPTNGSGAQVYQVVGTPTNALVLSAITYDGTNWGANDIGLSGRGFFVKNPTTNDLLVLLRGRVQNGPFTNACYYGYTSAGPMAPLDGGIETVHGYPRNSSTYGDSILKWNPAGTGWVTYEIDEYDHTWYPSEPTFTAGEGCIVRHMANTNTFNWTKSFTLP